MIITLFNPPAIPSPPASSWPSKPTVSETGTPWRPFLFRCYPEAVLLACTELILVAPEVPWIDTAEVHALAAWRRALAG